MASAGINILEVTIAAGATESNEVAVGGALLLGMDLPTMTGATIKIQNNVGAGYKDVVGDDGTTYSITAADGSFVALDAFFTAGLNNIKLVSASTEAALRTIKLVTKNAS